jgi:hypothetical protein
MLRYNKSELPLQVKAKQRLGFGLVNSSPNMLTSQGALHGAHNDHNCAPPAIVPLGLPG